MTMNNNYSIKLFRRYECVTDHKIDHLETDDGAINEMNKVCISVLLFEEKTFFRFRRSIRSFTAHSFVSKNSIVQINVFANDIVLCKVTPCDVRVDSSHIN